MYLVPTLEALPARASDAVFVVDDFVRPIAELIIEISSKIDNVLMMSRKKKKPSTYPGLVMILRTNDLCY